LTRGIADTGIAVGAMAALALGVYRVQTGAMGLPSLLVILMLGVEVFRPLRELRVVLHQGMLGTSAAQGILAILRATPEVRESDGVPPVAALTPSVTFADATFAYPGGRRARRERRGVHHATAAGLPDRRRRARRPALRRPAAAHRDRPRAAARRPDPDPRRGAVLRRRRERGGHPAGARSSDAGTHDAGVRAPSLERRERRSHPRAGRRPRRRDRHASRADGSARRLRTLDGGAGRRRGGAGGRRPIDGGRRGRDAGGQREARRGRGAGGGDRLAARHSDLVTDGPALPRAAARDL